MFSISPDIPEIMCPSCHRMMIPMNEYFDVVDGDGFGIDSPLLLGSGRSRMVNPFIGLEVFSKMIDSVLNVFRNKKGRQLCREILPRYPNSQICTECLFVYKRP